MLRESGASSNRNRLFRSDTARFSVFGVYWIARWSLHSDSAER